MALLCAPAAILTTAVPAAAQSPVASAGRAETPLATGWRFRFGNAPAAVTGAGFDDRDWQAVAVPHTWNRLGNYAVTRRTDANVDRGVGWYRLRFTAPRAGGGRRVYLQFHAASIIADVWVNGVHLGRHAGAFTRFRVDATDALRPGADNVLAVRVDNSKPAPGSSTEFVVPISGDFYMFGGLYRPVSMIVTGAAHVDLLDRGGPGMYGRVATLTDAAATVGVRTRLRNDAVIAAPVRVRTAILDAAGRTVARDDRAVTLPAQGGDETERMLTVRAPRRWAGRADPYLYRLVVEVRDAAGRALDRVVEPLGLRTVAIDSDRGFILNGQPLRLRGVTRHQDRLDKGWAITDADHAQDMALIADMGANTVRLSHYNQAKPIHDLADRRGIALWAELGIVNLASIPGVADTPAPMWASAQDQMVEMIRQNYNHPSVVVWSTGNEITNWTSIGVTPSNARPLMQALSDLAHREDPSRPTTIAVCCEPLPGEPDKGLDTTSGTADTVAYNLYRGWYGTSQVADAAELGPIMAALHRQRPRLPVGVGEYGAGAAVTQHTDDPLGGRIEAVGRPQAEEVQSRVHELSWKGMKSQDFLWGTWVWQMFDATSDVRQEGDASDINTKGLVTADRRIRKDAYYFYQASWTTAPMIHLTGSRYTDRAYRVVDVRAYSNAPRATLTLNGRAVGAADCVDAICVWPGVRLSAGDNRLVASVNGATDRVSWRYAGPQRALHIRTGSLAGVVAGTTRYGSDAYFSGGIGNTLNPFRKSLYGSNANRPVDRVVAGAVPAGLYASWRAGSRFRYALPLPDGRYRVTLHLFDPEATKAGERVFTVTPGGGAARSVDIVALAGGGMTATRVELPAMASGGVLSLDFVASKGEAVVSAIDVLPES